MNFSKDEQEKAIAAEMLEKLTKAYPYEQIKVSFNIDTGKFDINGLTTQQIEFALDK